mmetsp:Transcript_18114/g.50899  ORF Transcript_18114/g.50899 Transcript_18114/m.50899 type:complete len:190 (+) Transcript_18114:2384-2953(+)
MYSEHLNKWLKVYPAHQMLIIPSEKMKVPQDMKDSMARFAQFLGLPDSGAALVLASSRHTNLQNDHTHVHILLLCLALRIVCEESYLPPLSVSPSSSIHTPFIAFSGPRVHHDLIFKSSPAAKGVGSDGHVHENGRTYIAESPAELSETLHKVFCPKNQELAQLLLDKNLITQVDDIPWLATALKRDVC